MSGPRACNSCSTERTLAPRSAEPGPPYIVNWTTTIASNGSPTLSARARDVAGNVTLATNVGVIVSNDTTPPTASLTEPAAGATVAGPVVVTASASDNVGISGVQFLLDGANLGAEVAGPGPTYSVTWTTTTATNGAHTLSARPRDAAANTSLAANVGGVVSNAAPGPLLAAYAFNEGIGTTTADSSGNAITGTLSGATWTTAGKYGNALSFTGANAYVNLGNPTALEGTGSMSWTAWVYATAVPGDDGNILAKSNASSGWQFKTSPGTGPHTFAIAMSGGSGFVQRNSQTIRALNTWYHVPAVYNAMSRTLDIYVNGILDNGITVGDCTCSADGSEYQRQHRPAKRPVLLRGHH